MAPFVDAVAYEVKVNSLISDPVLKNALFEVSLTPNSDCARSYIVQVPSVKSFVEGIVNVEFVNPESVWWEILANCVIFI